MFLKEGERVKGPGRVEFYLDNHLDYISIMPKNAVFGPCGKSENTRERPRTNKILQFDRTKGSHVRRGVPPAPLILLRRQLRHENCLKLLCPIFEAQSRNTVKVFQVSR